LVSKAAKSVSAPGKGANRAAVRVLVAGSLPISPLEPSTSPWSTQPVPKGTPVPSRGAGGRSYLGGGGEGAGGGGHVTLVPLAKEPFTTGLVIWYSAQRSAASASASAFSAFSRSRAAETAATDASKYRTVATRPNLFAGFKETSNPSVTFAPSTAASSAAVAAVAFAGAPPSLSSGAASDSSRNAVRSDASRSSASWNHACVGANPASKNVSVSKESVPSTGFAATPRNDVRNAAAGGVGAVGGEKSLADGVRVGVHGHGRERLRVERDAVVQRERRGEAPADGDGGVERERVKRDAGGSERETSRRRLRRAGNERPRARRRRARRRLDDAVSERVQVRFGHRKAPAPRDRDQVRGERQRAPRGGVGEHRALALGERERRLLAQRRRQRVKRRRAHHPRVAGERGGGAQALLDAGRRARGDVSRGADHRGDNRMRLRQRVQADRAAAPHGDAGRLRAPAPL
jgi:hypothetical protein